MSEAVRVRAHRILRAIPRFIFCQAGDQVSRSGCLQANEEVVGVYQNESSGVPNIVVTTEGLRIGAEDGASFISFSRIQDVSLPPGRDKTHRGVCLKLVDGNLVLIPVLGGAGKFNDALEFLRFISRVIADIQNRRFES